MVNPYSMSMYQVWLKYALTMPQLWINSKYSMNYQEVVRTWLKHLLSDPGIDGDIEFCCVFVRNSNG